MKNEKKNLITHFLRFLYWRWISIINNIFLQKK